MLSHILSTEEKNAIIFTFDITTGSSFHKYLKRAIKELIFSYEEISDIKEKRMIPFIILGMKNDLDEKHKVSKEDVQKLMDVLKKHVSCEIHYTEATNKKDI